MTRVKQGELRKGVTWERTGGDRISTKSHSGFLQTNTSCLPDNSTYPFLTSHLQDVTAIEHRESQSRRQQRRRRAAQLGLLDLAHRPVQPAKAPLPAQQRRCSCCWILLCPNDDLAEADQRVSCFIPFIRWRTPISDKPERQSKELEHYCSSAESPHSFCAQEHRRAGGKGSPKSAAPRECRLASSLILFHKAHKRIPRSMNRQ